MMELAKHLNDISDSIKLLQISSNCGNDKIKPKHILPVELWTAVFEEMIRTEPTDLYSHGVQKRKSASEEARLNLLSCVTVCKVSSHYPLVFEVD